MTATRRFWIALGGVTFIGLVIRFVNVLVWRPTDPNCEGLDGCFRIAGDAAYGHYQGELLAQGHGFASSAAWVSFGEIRPGAGDPPLYAMYLGLVSALNGSGGTGTRLVGLVVLLVLVGLMGMGVRIFAGPRAGRIAFGVAGATAALLLFVSVVPGSPGTAHRLASGVAGAAGVAVVGIVARYVAGRRAGLIAAALAAVYPMLWINDGMLLSESLYVPLVMLAVLAGYHFWREPSLLNAVWVGIALALATLTRAEALLLFAFMLLPLAWGLRRIDPSRRIGWVVVSGLVGAAMLVPWLGYNLARFDEPVFMTAGTGAVLSAGSCDTAYRGEFAGYYGANCFAEYVADGRAEWPDTSVDESVRDVPARDAAVEYIGEHLGELPRVMVLRVGRMWDLYKPGQNVELNYKVEGRGVWASKAGLAMYFALLVPAVAGLWLLWRRRLPISPLVSVLAMVTVTAALTFGVTRYRAPADAVLVLLAAVALDALIGRWRPVGDDPIAVPTKDEVNVESASEAPPDEPEPVGVPERV